jgi:hypothetical protein
MPITVNRMTWLRALYQPWTLGVALVGYSSAVLVATWPGLGSYAGGWPLLVALTVICQALMVLVDLRSGTLEASVHDSDTLLAEVYEVRSRIGRKIEAIPGDALKSGLPALLGRLDQEILPELRRLVGKNQQLEQELRAYRGSQRGRLRPSEKTLRELEDLHARQRTAIDEVVQQIVDLDASLSGLIQEGDERGIITSVQEWNARISERWRALREMSVEG